MKATPVTLEDVLEGRRCTPLTTQEFELFLMHKAHSIENLQFVRWYQEYRKRFADLPYEEQARSTLPPVGSVLLGREKRATASSPKTLLSWAMQRTNTRSGSPEAGRDSSPFGRPWQPLQEEEASPVVFSSRTLPASFWRRRGSKQDDDDLSCSFGPICRPGQTEEFMLRNRRGSKDVQNSPSRRGSAQGDLGTPSITISPARVMHTESAAAAPRFGASEEALPYAHEVSRIVATFFGTKAPSELNVDSALRDALLQTLALDADGLPRDSTHPDCFQRVEELCMGALRDVALPDFLRFAVGNINRSKELFWYAIGITDIALGLLVSLCCLFFVHTRWARLGGLPFICFGCMQIFSATKHFCTQVYGRDARQLYPWEMASGDSTDQESAEMGSLEKKLAPNVISPWDSGPLSSLDAVPSLQKGSSSVVKLELAGIRVPIFGPETAIKDAYVQKVHKRLITVILVVGAVGVVVFGAVLLAIPEQS